MQVFGLAPAVVYEYSVSLCDASKVSFVAWCELAPGDDSFAQKAARWARGATGEDELIAFVKDLVFAKVEAGLVEEKVHLWCSEPGLRFEVLDVLLPGFSLVASDDS